MVSLSWCKYIQRDLFPLNNPRFSSGITGAFTYSIWKAVCPLLSSEVGRITEKKTEKFNQILLLLQGLSWLLILFKEEEREHSISSVLYKFQHSRAGWFLPGRRHLEVLPSACHDMGWWGGGGGCGEAMSKGLLQHCNAMMSETVLISLLIVYDIIVDLHT